MKLTVIFGALAAIAALITPVSARHLDINDCIQVNGKWYCPIEQCHYTVPKKPVRFNSSDNGSHENNGTIVIVVPDDDTPPSNPPDDNNGHGHVHDDNGHGNDPGKVDPSNPGKSKE